MGDSRDKRQGVPGSTRPAASATVRHAVRDQEILWDEFLAMARAVVDSLALGVDAICDGRLEVIPDASHLCFAERPDLWMPIANEFLADAEA